MNQKRRAEKIEFNMEILIRIAQDARRDWQNVKAKHGEHSQRECEAWGRMEAYTTAAQVMTSGLETCPVPQNTWSVDTTAKAA
mgnify:CR=1 FL=1